MYFEQEPEMYPYLRGSRRGIDMGIHSGYTKVALPGREFMAIRLQRVK